MAGSANGLERASPLSAGPLSARRGDRRSFFILLLLAAVIEVTVFVVLASQGQETFRSVVVAPTPVRT